MYYGFNESLLHGYYWVKVNKLYVACVVSLVRIIYFNSYIELNIKKIYPQPLLYYENLKTKKHTTRIIFERVSQEKLANSRRLIDLDVI